jgi:imidazolonepropionase
VVTDLVLSGADQVLVPREAGLPHLRRPGAESLTTEPGSVAVADGRIAALEDDPGAATRIDASGCSVVPGFVDCHTHLPFAGWRALEYAGKVAGESYAAIARAGGGIGASVRSLADTADDDVLAQSAAVAAEMLATGTTCLELKSGYGGGLAGERRQLLLARSLGDEVAQDTSITALVAHTAPEGFTADAWLDELAGALDGLLDATGASSLDIFVEDVAFTIAHLERLGALAHDHGLALRAHVEQLASHGSVPVALAAGARSVDHLSCLPDKHVGLLAAAPCAAVLLPGAELLNDERTAPARALADAGAICVLATDCNPGTSPIASLPLIVGLAVRRYRWTVLEALAAVTLNAAWVLGRDRELGSIEAGKRADLLLLDGPIEHLPYRLGRSPVAAVVLGGEAVHVRPDAAWRVEGVPVP